MEIEHVVFSDDDTVLKSFSNSSWYDTATPYQFCISELRELKNEIKNNRRIYIESNGIKYQIFSLNEFRIWIEEVFLGGFENIFFMIMNEISLQLKNLHF